MYAHGWVLGAKAKLEWLPGGKAGRQAPLVPKRQLGVPGASGSAPWPSPTPVREPAAGKAGVAWGRGPAAWSRSRPRAEGTRQGGGGPPAGLLPCPAGAGPQPCFSAAGAPGSRAHPRSRPCPLPWSEGRLWEPRRVQHPNHGPSDSRGRNARSCPGIGAAQGRGAGSGVKRGVGGGERAGAGTKLPAKLT